MESLLGLLASSPITASIALVACICLLAGYYFFVIPMFKENTDLKLQNKQLTDDLSALSKRTVVLLDELKIDNTALKALFNTIYAEAIVNIKQQATTIADITVTTEEKVLQEIEEGFNKVLKELEDSHNNIHVHELKQTVVSHINGMTIHFNSVQSILTDVRNICDAIKDKQIFLNGMLIANSGTAALNNNIGVK